MNFIPVNEPLLNGNEKKYLCECIDSGWISSEGPFVKEFEQKISARVGRRYGVAVSNGTAALEVVVQALGIKAGDEVIMPAFTIISCAMAVTKQGGIPVLVDSDPSTWNMNADEIEEKITDKTRAIIMVHLYGLPVDVDKIYYSVDQPPEYPGGMQAMLQFISENLRYPEEQLEEGIQGRVIIKFYVDTLGRVCNPAVDRGKDSALDKEALRVVGMFPDYTPGMINGRRVNTWVRLPIVFKLPAVD